MELAMIPTRQRVILPGIVVRMKVRDPALCRLITERLVSQVGQKPAPISVALVTVENDEPLQPGQSPPRLKTSQLHKVACAAQALRVEQIAGGEQFNLVMEGVARVKVQEYTQTEPYMMAKVEHVPEPVWIKGEKETEGLVLTLRALTKEFIMLRELKMPPSLLSQITKYMENYSPGQLADFITATADITVDEKLKILDSFDLKTRLTNTIAMLKKQIQATKVLLAKQPRDRLSSRFQDDKADELADELDALEKKINDANISPEVQKVVNREIKKLKRIPPSQPEHTVVKTYLEWISDLPWNVSTKDDLSIDKARNQLDMDHFGLDKVKKRILEYLAVKKLKDDLKGPILCFVGPPGVGKTSLGRSIADSLGRKFYRMSLGGVRDEAEIRGHRRTYVGALPGRIIQAMKKVGSNNPVILLDEIDKLGHDHRGDPSSALLEVLDPEQNSTFSDHYLGVPFDLSKTLFVATANSLETIPAPLLDRMELVEIPGYTPEEKLKICRSHLLPKQVKQHGLRETDFVISDETLSQLISQYTREAGVRSLDRQVAALCRYIAMQKVDGKQGETINIHPDMLLDILGPERFEDEVSERLGIPGVVAGLAYTQYGGALLFVEASKMPGKGSLILTGKLGDVMKESAQAALSWVRANSALIGLSEASIRSVAEKSDIHLHFPAGATPKDGPSAGVTIVTALVSLLTDRPVQPYTAMTGEIALRGLVLPVGGIKEKVLAAHRAGVKRVILPFRNKKDLADLPANVVKELEFIPVKTIPEVLRAAFQIEDWSEFSEDKKLFAISSML